MNIPKKEQLVFLIVVLYQGLLLPRIMTDFDLNILQYIATFRNTALNDFFLNITHLADTKAVIIFGCTLFFYSLKKLTLRDSLLNTLLFCVPSILSPILKSYYLRPRPYTLDTQIALLPLETLSMPSGHAINAVVIYGGLLYLLAHSKINTALKISLMVVCFSLIFLLGFSRMYLGLHFLSDVCVGFLFALVIFQMLLPKNKLLS